ncbi:MAG: three-Cys-motif partner protein TcmP [Dehalococcoidia bacterium]
MSGDEDLRDWGDWTHLKLEILKQYLDRFTTATKFKSPTVRVFLDAFAGQGRGRSRETGAIFEGSPRIALRTVDPPFTHLRFFELDPTHADALQRTLDTEFPGRDILVYEGDSNARIQDALADLHTISWAPMFAFLDPDGIELSWSTLSALAKHRKGKYKVEMWMLFSTMGLVRRLALDEAKLRTGDEQAATDAFGDESWRPIYDQRRRATINGQQARGEYINLYRWKLEKELGYAHTFALEIRNNRGVPIYAMIFATDHVAGKRIMSSLYHKAALDAPRRRELVKTARDGVKQMQFRFGDDVAVRDPVWEDEPWEPPEH